MTMHKHNKRDVLAEEKYAFALIQKQDYIKLSKDFELLINRILHEIHTLSRRAASNFGFSCALTLIALGSLLYIVLNAQVNYGNVATVLSYYLSRFSFVIFIEFLAYFFLKLYKKNLEDAKYYHNELTNVQSKIISLKSALLIKDDAAIINIISELSKTERNFILKKGETTIEVEKSRIDASRLKEIINFGSFFSNKGRK